MKKRLLPLCLAANALTLASHTHAAPEPFVELEAMKMFCTVPVDLTHSNTQIAQDIEPIISTMPWLIRLHPDANPMLQIRFEEIIQLVANNVGHTIGTFEPQISLNETEQTLEREKPLANQKHAFYKEEGIHNVACASLLKPLPIMGESQMEVEDHYHNQREPEDTLDILSFPSPPSGGKSIQRGGPLFGKSGFDYFAFVSRSMESLVQKREVAFSALRENEPEVERGTSPLQAQLSKVLAPVKSPEPFAQQDFNINDFLNKLQKAALVNWVKAEVLSPLIAGLLLLLTYLQGDLLLPRATALLSRIPRRREVAF